MSLLDNAIHLLAPLTANCSRFEQKWTAAEGLAGIGGRWEGEWISQATGHRGRLRSVVNPVAPALWRLYFRAEYAKVFRACYATDFDVVQEPERWTFSGASDLGVLAGGVYEYRGHATLEAMICTYRSTRDHGEFRLRRVRTT